MVRDFSIFAERRNRLRTLVDGPILLLGAFENSRTTFRQDSSFYYFTGITEPAVALLLDSSSTLFIPDYNNRSKWVVDELDFYKDNKKLLGIDTVDYLGDKNLGFNINLFFSANEYKNLLDSISGKRISILSEQSFILDRLNKYTNFTTVDISSQVANLRRTKSSLEIVLIINAINLTAKALEHIQGIIRAGVTEIELKAAIEFVYANSAAIPAFPTIVASGKNSTILHFSPTDRKMKDGELVLIDTGAEVNYYSADISRTFPVSGKFTTRQKEIYNIVLDTQKYIASIAKPGYCLSNCQNEDVSLHHLAKKFLKGYEKYFTHGIGHFLGLDTHDLGDPADQLKEGDVITIEPGIYIPEENIGIRIEDNFLIQNDSALPLSQVVPAVSQT